MRIIDKPLTIIYDGSLEGYFTVIFDIYQQKYKVEDIVKSYHNQPTLFTSSIIVETDIKKAERVLRSITEKVNRRTMQDILTTFLAENESQEMQMFHFIRKILNNKVAEKDYRDEHVLSIFQIAQKVKREAHRFKGLIRFKRAKDGIYTATIEPDYNILPLLSQHFHQRYADQQWIIFDLKRQKGLFYLHGKVEMLSAEKEVISLSNDQLHDEELLFQKMWQEYYKNVNISERKNLRLQRQHMPSRYWKHLTEI